MDVVQALPRDIQKQRQLLFSLPLPFSLSTTNYKLFWPLIDNVYSIHKTVHVTNHVLHSRHYVNCRFKRVRRAQSQASQSSRASTTKRSIKSCNVTFRILQFVDHVEFQLNGNQLTNHDHSLDESDANKRNSFLRDLLARDISKNYAPAAVIGSIRGNGQSDTRERLNDAGGRYLTRQDAINSGASWRLANPNALFVSYTRGCTN